VQLPASEGAGSEGLAPQEPAAALPLERVAPRRPRL